MRTNQLLYLIIIFAAFAGFLLAFYLWHKKKSKETFMCPLRARCDTVMRSEYSRFLGLPVELLGLAYYAAIAASYAAFLVWPELINSTFVLGVFTATTSAFLFSLYLTFIQAFALKQWCSWCLVSAGICTVIFLTAVSLSKFGLTHLLEENHNLILLFHGLGVALGVGGATIADLFFFKFLKDFRISEWEAEALATLSQVIWVALALLVVTGIGLYLPEAGVLREAPRFLAKVIMVAVIIVAGAALNLLVAPRLVKISFGEKHEHEAGELHHIRKLAFALGAVSLVSWYSVFVLGSLREFKWNFGEFMVAYTLVLLGGIIASQLMERSFNRSARRE